MLNLELHTYNDGTLRLVYEEHLHGKDREFVLHDDGTASEATTDEEGENEVLTPINLAYTLRAMLEQA